MRLPLEGVRVLDLTVWQQGPYATALLADLGADVVKIEETRAGDPGRGAWVAQAPAGNGLSSYFHAHNRGKRSLAVDLKHPAGRDAVLRLAKTADIFLNNLRPSVIKRLGLHYEEIARVNPAIVYVQASGYGPQGPDADLGAFDFLAQARAGFVASNGEPDDPPLPTMIPIGDQSGALHAAVAALAGLAGRNATGRGCKMDTSLLGSMIALQSFDVTTYLFSDQLRQRQYRGGSRPFWRVYRGGDGQWFVIGMLLNRAWAEFCDVIGRLDIVDDERFTRYSDRVGTHAPALCAIMDEAFATAPAAEWVAKLNAIGMFSALAQDYAQLAQDPQASENGYIQDVARPGGDPVRMAASGIAVDGVPAPIRALAPELGEHSEDVLLEAGYTWDEIVQLRHEGVIGPTGGGKPPEMDG